MKLHNLLEMLMGALATGEPTPSGVMLAPHVVDYLEAGLARAAHHARQTEGLAIASVIDFAKQGEPRPSAEVLDLSEIFGREQVSRHASEPGPGAKLYAFPTVPRLTGMTRDLLAPEDF